MHTARLPHFRLAPAPLNQLVALSNTLREGSLGPALVALVDVRASQLNGCGYCLDMHARQFLAVDPDLQRLNSVAAWREASCYSERERAALQWVESLTLLAATQAPQQDFDALRDHFNDAEIVELTLVAAVINAWNRISVGMRVPVARKPLAPA